MYILKLFFKIVKLKFLAMIEYPGAFLGGVVAQWISYGIEIFLLFYLVRKFGSLGGFLPDEVMFLYALWLMSYAIGASFTFNICRDLPSMAVNGNLDEALIRPMPPMIYLISTNYNLGYFSHLSLTTVVLIVSISHLHMSWALWQWVWLAAILLSGAVIQGSMMILCNLPALRTKSDSPTGVFFWELREFAKFPINIYSNIIQIIFTVILPYGFVNFYPMQALLGKREGVFNSSIMWFAPFVALLVFVVTALCWRKVIRQNESSGT